MLGRTCCVQMGRHRVHFQLMVWPEMGSLVVTCGMPEDTRIDDCHPHQEKDLGEGAKGGCEQKGVGRK